MTLAHVRLAKIREDAVTVKYAAQTPDFSSHGEWETVAEILIDKTSKNFTFMAVNRWKGEAVVPPQIYALPERERSAALAGEYLGYGYGAWTGRMLGSIQSLLSLGEFPDQA